MKKILVAFLLVGALLFGCTQQGYGNAGSGINAQGNAAIDSSQQAGQPNTTPDSDLGVQPMQEPSTGINDTNDSALNVN